MRALLFLLLMLPGLSWGQTGIPPWPSGGLPSTSYPFNASGNLLSTYLGTPTFNWTFDQAVGATVVADSGQTMTQGGTGTTRVADATWPNGISSATPGYAYRLNGSGYFTSAITVANLTGATGKMSGIAIVTPTTVSGYGIIACNWHSGGTAGWVIWRATTGYQFIVSDNGEDSGGTHITYVNVNSSAAVGKMSVVGWSYDPTGGDGAATMKLWVDSETEGSSTTANGPIYTSASAMEVGTTGGGSNFSGWIHGMMIQPTTMTATQFAYLRDVYRGKMVSKGSAVTTTWATPGSLQLAPADSGVEPFIVDMPTSGSMVGKIGTNLGGMSMGVAVTNLLYRSKICATVSGSAPTGWGATTSPGTGSAAISCTDGSLDANNPAADGLKSIKITLTGTDSLTQLQSNCMTTGIGGDVYGSVWAKKNGTGTTKLNMYLYQYSGANCGSGFITGTFFFANKNVTNSWVEYGGRHPAASWDPTAVSYKVDLLESGDNWTDTTEFIDVPMVYVGSEDVSYSCTSDADATTACTVLSHTGTIPGKVSGWAISGVWIPNVGEYNTSATCNYPLMLMTSGANRIALQHRATNLNRVFQWSTVGAGNSACDVTLTKTAKTAYTFAFGNMTDGTEYCNVGSTVGTVTTDGSGIFDSAPNQLILGNGALPDACWVNNIKLYTRFKR